MILAERNGTQPSLVALAAVQRTAVAECLRLYHPHERFAKDEHDTVLLEYCIPYALQDGRKGGVCPADILELVEHHDLLSVRWIVSENPKDGIRVSYIHILEQCASRKASHGLLKRHAVLLFALFRREVVHEGFVPPKFPQERGFAKTTASVVDDNETVAASRVDVFRSTQLPHAVYKHVPASYTI